MTNEPADIPAVPAAPAEDPHRTTIELDVQRLGNVGNRLLGRVEATQDAARQVLEWSRQTLDLRERQTLLNVARALAFRLEEHKAELGNYATSRGIAKPATPKIITEPEKAH